MSLNLNIGVLVMEFRKKVALCNVVSSWYYHEGNLNIFIDYSNFVKFKNVFKDEAYLFDELEIKGQLREDCICVFEFDKFLKELGLQKEEISEMFD